jgi:hypothetical protein
MALIHPLDLKKNQKEELYDLIKGRSNSKDFVQERKRRRSRQR